MSTPKASSSSNPQQASTWEWKARNALFKSTSSKPATESKVRASSSASAACAQSSTPKPYIHVQDAHVENQDVDKIYAKRKRRRVLDEEERSVRDGISQLVAQNLAFDQLMTAYPEVDEPFEDKRDVVNRLLPYHIYQHPRQELDALRGLKGKDKATELDFLKEEIKETKFAIECHRRFDKIQARIRKARQKPGKNASPLDQQIVLERQALEVDRIDTTSLEQELSASRSELEKINRAARQAKASANKGASGSSHSASNSTASNSFSSSSPFATYSNPAFSSTPAPNFSNYYNSYSYPYNATFLPGVSFIHSKNSPTPTRTPLAQATPAPATQQSTTAANGTGATPRPPPVAIPLQLPVSALPILQSLGILPVPKASLPPPSEPQPAAVLVGSANNLLNLEINAGLLQAPQMSGLAMLLSNLVKFGGSSNGSGSGDGSSGSGGKSTSSSQQTTSTNAGVSSGASGSKTAVNSSTK